jgi:O-antigen ligase
MPNSKINYFDRYIIFLFSIFPISILIGNLFINLVILFISLLFIFKLINKKLNIFKFKKNYILFFLLLFFFLSLVVNVVFSKNIYLSYPRVLKIFFVIFFILAFKFLITEYSLKLNNVYKIWNIIFFIVIADIIFEFFVGHNILGQESVMPGRIGSFTGQESVIGGYILGFCLISLSFLYNKIKNNLISILIAIFFIIVSFFIGERANFIRTLLAIILFILLVYEISIKKKIISIILIFLSIYLLFLNINSDYKQRYFKQISYLFTSNGITKFLDNSQYGAHRNVAKEIFIDNPIFGVGIKNFRIESRNEKYDDLDHKKNEIRAANHPHQIYYEFLSETGLFGLASFLIFISYSIFLSLKNYIKKKNIYQFSALIYIVLAILPIIPTGSFLGTFPSSIFWINYAIMMGYNTKD